MGDNTALISEVEAAFDRYKEAAGDFQISQFVGDPDEVVEEHQRKAIAAGLEMANLIRAGAPNPGTLEDGPQKDQFLEEFYEGATVDSLMAVVNGEG